MPMPRGTRSEHGTDARYQGCKGTAPCRCDDCREAHATRVRNLRNRGRSFVRPYNRRLPG